MTWILLAAMTPACLWLWYFNRLDKRPEPVWLIALAFVGGVACVPIAYALEIALMPWLPELDAHRSFAELFLSATIIAGAVEETLKFLVVASIAAWRHEFDEPVDGLIYAVATAMGFTAAEDLMKLSGGIEWGVILSPPGHAMFAVFWGYELGRQRGRHGWAPKLWITLGLALSIVAHGLWDAFSFYREGPGSRDWVSAAVFILAVALFWRLESRLRDARLHETDPPPRHPI